MAGLLSIIMGHAILRYISAVQGYEYPLATSMIIATIGGFFVGPLCVVLMILFVSLQFVEWILGMGVPIYRRFAQLNMVFVWPWGDIALAVTGAALIGATGSKILQDGHHKALDPVRAALATVLGTSILAGVFLLYNEFYRDFRGLLGYVRDLIFDHDVVHVDNDHEMA